MAIEYFKSIIQGRLEFGNPRSYEQVQKMLVHRAESYYRDEINIDLEEIFDEETHSIVIPRHITQSTEKYWKNTYSLLKYAGQFAVSGFIGAWFTDKGKIIHYGVIEPSGDKMAVQEFIKAKELIDEGKEQEAIKALDKTIETFNRHALAYEHRGHVNFELKKYHDALRDYSKSLALDPHNPFVYRGRARVHIQNENWAEAIQDLDSAIRNSLALQSIYWICRKLKAECHLKLKELEKAAFEYKLFVARSFNPTGTNYRLKPFVRLRYAELLMELENFAEAAKQAELALKEQNEFSDKQIGHAFFILGSAKKSMGKSGFKADFASAKEHGYES